MSTCRNCVISLGYNPNNYETGYCNCSKDEIEFYGIENCLRNCDTCNDGLYCPHMLYKNVSK